MTKLIFTLLLGCFCIYGFDRMGVISTDGFETDHHQMADAEKGKTNTVVAHQRFTDRIAAKNKIL